MSCENPNIAVRIGLDPDTGKSRIKFFGKKGVGRANWNIESLIDRYGSDNVLFLDCGHCPSCIKKRRKEWSVRCELEARCHLKNSFVTLTYDDEHYSKLDLKKDVRSFFKSLWNHDIKFRYYGCSEKGGQTGRWHHHIILFGFIPDDLKVFSKTKSGGYQYTSKFIDSIWKKGFATVCEFEPGLAAYVAGYVNKKLEDPDDESYQFMSTRPGIGFPYAASRIQDIYESSSLVTTFGSHKASVPRYFDKIAEQCGVDLSDVRLERAENAMIGLHQKARYKGAHQLDLVVGINEMSEKDRFNTLRKRGL